jgi:hypothetical protein
MRIKAYCLGYKNSLCPGPNETHPQPPDSSVAILTLLAHLGMGLPSGLPCFISPSVTLYAFLVFSVFATVSIRVIVVHLSVALFGYHCKWLDSSSCSFLQPLCNPSQGAAIECDDFPDSCSYESDWIWEVKNCMLYIFLKSHLAHGVPGVQ